GDERVTPRANRFPSAALRGRRLSDRFEKPARNQRMKPGHHVWEDPAGALDLILSDPSLRGGQGNQPVLARLTRISRKPLGTAAEIGESPIELHVLAIQRERPGANAVEQIVVRQNPL